MTSRKGKKGKKGKGENIQFEERRLSLLLVCSSRILEGRKKKKDIREKWAEMGGQRKKKGRGKERGKRGKNRVSNSLLIAVFCH